MKIVVCKMKKITIIVIFFYSGLNLFAQDLPDELYMDAFVVVSDTSENYYYLRDKMFDLSTELKSKIDTMGRGFDDSKNLICLSTNDEDKIYAGDYYPRRYSSETLSLEHLNYYLTGQKPNSSTMALVICITDNREEAENKLAQLKLYSDDAFIIESRIYMGCMH